jgi:AraC-like DNA-binding protein
MLITLNYQRVVLTPKIPAGWESICMRGSSVQAWEGEAGTLLTETIAVDVFSILLVRVFLRSMEPIELRIQKPSSYFFFCIEGCWQIHIPKQQTTLQQDQYYICSTATLQLVPAIVTGRMLQLLVISSDSDNFCTGENNLLQPIYAPAAMMDFLLQLTHSSFVPQPRAYHKKLLHDIIGMAKTIATDEKTNTGKLTHAELEALYKVGMLIEKDLTQHHTIEELTAYSGMNRDKLTSSFKSLFKQSIYAYYLSKRMELAKYILTTSHLPIKMVAKKTGYHNATNFSIAFKKFFGLTPAQMRRLKPD